MINATIEGFLAIWPRVFPFLAIYFVLITLLALISSIILGLAAKNVNEEVVGKFLFQKEFPVRISTFRGYFKNNAISLLFFMWIDVLLVPAISFLPIMIFDASFQITDFIILGFPFSVLLLYFVFPRFHRRFEQPKFYFFPGGIGIQTFGNDLLIPTSAIKQLRIDPDEITAAMNIKYRFIPSTWGWLHFKFDTQEQLIDFKEKINFQIDLPWKDHSYSRFRYKVLKIPFNNIKLIKQTEMEKEVNSKTQRVIDQRNNYIDKTEEEKNAFPYMKFVGWTSLLSMVFMLLPLLTLGVVGGNNENDVLLFVLYGMIAISLIAFTAERIHFQKILPRKPNFILLTFLLGIILFVNSMMMSLIIDGFDLAEASRTYLVASFLTAYIIGGFVLFYVLIETRFRHSSIQWKLPRCSRCTQIITTQTSTCPNCKQQILNTNNLVQREIKEEVRKNPIEKSEANVTYCPVCGKPRFENGKFCITCGYEFIDKDRKE